MDHHVLILSAVGLFAILMGLLLNIIITKLPQQLHREWQIQANEMLEDSRVIFQPGKQKKWLVVLLTVLLFIITALHFELTFTTLPALILTAILIAITLIDIDHQIVPDVITLPALWLGLGLNIFNIFTDLTSGVIGAMAGYLFLWSVFWIFKLIFKREGLGYGDFKLLAMLGACLGWQALPGIIFLSSAAGSLYGITLILRRQKTFSQPIPFGPFLALAGWLSLLYGAKMNALYLNLMHL
ncbi:MAG: prepilin peptidase [Candidatus Berkiellales bacterium]